ncbi:hypothetical protein [Streptomyces sp900116325]
MTRPATGDASREGAGRTAPGGTGTTPAGRPAGVRVPLRRCFT